MTSAIASDRSVTSRVLVAAVLVPPSWLVVHALLCGWPFMPFRWPPEVLWGAMLLLEQPAWGAKVWAFRELLPVLIAPFAITFPLVDLLSAHRAGRAGRAVLRLSLSLAAAFLLLAISCLYRDPGWDSAPYGFPLTVIDVWPGERPRLYSAYYLALNSLFYLALVQPVISWAVDRFAAAPRLKVDFEQPQSVA